MRNEEWFEMETVRWLPLIRSGGESENGSEALDSGSMME